MGLKDNYRLIIPDMRGYNKSDKPEGIENYNTDLLISDIKVLAKELEIKIFNLGGHDWGGLVAWIFAEKYPELVNKLIILNAPHPVIFTEKLSNDSQQQKASNYIFHFQSKDGEKFLIENNYQGLQLAVFSGSRNRKAFDKEDRKRYISAWSQPGAITAGVNYYRAFRPPYKGDGIIKVPTLVIWGMKDIFLLPKLLDNLDDFVSDLKIIRSEKSSHWILQDDPDLVIKSIKQFIENK